MKSIAKVARRVGGVFIPRLRAQNEFQYLDSLKRVLTEGTWLGSRTGLRRISYPGLSMRLDLAAGFPAITTRKLAFKSAIGELCAFLRGATSAKTFRDFGSRVWDKNANENTAWLENPYRTGADDLGPIYGYQWRRWDAYKVVNMTNSAQLWAIGKKGYRSVEYFDNHSKTDVDNEAHDALGLYHKKIDQLLECLEKIVHTPEDRRILFHAWNPAQLDEMALPPCHLLYQFMPNPVRKELSMAVYIRSNDMGLGSPFNICEGAALLSFVARLTGYTPRWFSYFVGDAHLYENQIQLANTVLSRTPFFPPTLKIAERIRGFNEDGAKAFDWLDNVEPSDFSLDHYRYHAPISAPMAV